MKHNTPAVALAASSLLAAALLAIPACRTTVFDADRCPVEVRADGSFAVDGKPCRMEDISRRLESMGFPKEVTVRVAVPDDVRNDVCAKVAGVMASGGYTKFFFVKPLQKESFIKEDRPKPEGGTPPPPSRRQPR